MTKSPSIVVKTLLTLAVAGSMVAFTALPAAAQNATSLNCKGCLTSKQIKNGKVKGKDLKDSTVTGSKIAPNAVDGGKIADGTVGTADLGSNAVTGIKIAPDAVDSSKVQGNSLDNSDIGDEAGIEFSSSGTRNVESPAIGTCSSYTVLASFTVTVPASSNSSYVFCQASGDADLDTADQSFRIGIDNATGTTAPDRERTLEVEADKVALLNFENWEEWAVQNVYTIGSAGGNSTYALKACRESAAATGNIRWDPLVCTVFPTRR